MVYHSCERLMPPISLNGWRKLAFLAHHRSYNWPRKDNARRRTGSVLSARQLDLGLTETVSTPDR